MYRILNMDFHLEFQVPSKVVYFSIFCIFMPGVPNFGVQKAATLSQQHTVCSLLFWALCSWGPQEARGPTAIEGSCGEPVVHSSRDEDQFLHE